MVNKYDDNDDDDDEQYWEKRTLPPRRSEIGTVSLPPAFPALCHHWHSNFTFQSIDGIHGRTKTFFSSGRRLKPMTFSLEHDLDIAEKNRHAKYAGQRSLRSNIIVRTQTHTGPISLSVPLTCK